MPQRPLKERQPIGEKLNVYDSGWDGGTYMMTPQTLVMCTFWKR